MCVTGRGSLYDDMSTHNSTTRDSPDAVQGAALRKLFGWENLH
jgi:hypothetical protein